MAFGYMELPYDVARRHEMPCAGVRQAFEHRVPKRHPRTPEEASEPPYLAVGGYDEAGRLVLDVLLLYRDEDLGHLEEDWHRLCTEPHLRLAELRWFERIDGHGTGRRRDGSVCMY